MSAALLALVVALLLFPVGSRNRLEALGVLAQPRRRLPLLPCACVVAVALIIALPVSVVAASSIVGVTVGAQEAGSPGPTSRH